MIISIEAGCIKVAENIYAYRYEDAAGFHEILFTSTVVPKIGDSIVDGTFVERTTYKINNDHSKWEQRYMDCTWPNSD